MSKHEHDEQLEQHLSGADRELEDALGGLRPRAAAGVDPLACAFEAGRTSARQSLRAWRAASGLLAATLAVVAVVLPNQSGRQTRSGTGSSVARNDALPLPPRHAVGLASSSRAGLANYYALRDDVLARGPDVLPAPAGYVPNPPRLRGR